MLIAYRPMSRAYVAALTERIELLEGMLIEIGRQVPPATYPPKTRNETSASMSASHAASLNNSSPSARSSPGDYADEGLGINYSHRNGGRAASSERMQTSGLQPRWDESDRGFQQAPNMVKVPLTTRSRPDGDSAKHKGKAPRRLGSDRQPVSNIARWSPEQQKQSEQSFSQPVTAPAQITQSLSNLPFPAQENLYPRTVPSNSLQVNSHPSPKRRHSSSKSVLPPPTTALQPSILPPPTTALQSSMAAPYYDFPAVSLHTLGLSNMEYERSRTTTNTSREPAPPYHHATGDSSSVAWSSMSGIEYPLGSYGVVDQGWMTSHEQAQIHPEMQALTGAVSREMYEGGLHEAENRY